MDDIICPECGRPNLGEAKKCWYCQTDLTNITLEPNSADIEVIPEAIPEKMVEEGKLSDGEEEKEIPDWLKRVRQHIEDDRDPEDEKPYWKQKDIFGGDKPKINKKTKEKKPAAEGKKKMDSKEKGKPGKNTAISEEKAKSEHGEDSHIGNELSEDLPDGFTKL